MNNVKNKDGNWSHVMEPWVSNDDNVFLVKQYVAKNGMRNSKSGNEVEGFLRSFSKNITKKYC